MLMANDFIFVGS